MKSLTKKVRSKLRLFSPVLHFGSLVLQMCLVGVVVAIVRRKFHFRAFVVGLGVSTVLGFFTWNWFIEKSFHDLDFHRVLFWLFAALTAIISGYCVGWAGNRVGYWENYALVLFAGVFFWFKLSIGFGFSWINPPSSASLLTEGAFNGIQLFGPYYERGLLITAILGFILTVLGGSLASLFHSEAKSFDGGLSLEWKICRRHLGGRYGIVSTTAVVAIMGVCLGVAALVSVNGVMSGYQLEIEEKILSTNPHIVVQKYGIDFSEYKEIGAKGLGVEGILAQTPFTFSEAMLSIDDKGFGVLLKGIDPQTAGDVTKIEQNLCELDAHSKYCIKKKSTNDKQLQVLLEAKGKIPKLLVGSGLFKRIGKPLGSIVALTTPVGIAGATGNAPKRMWFELAGIFETGMYEFDTRLAYLHFNAAQQLLGMGDTVHGVEFKVMNPSSVEQYNKGLLDAVLGYPYRTLDWRELNSGIFTALKLQKMVMFLVLVFIVIVAAFNIASTLFITVVEKSREIAILKSMGARDSTIMKIFVLEGVVVGLIGVLAGVAIGLGVCGLLAQLEISIASDVYMVEKLKIRIEAIEIGMVVFSALLISYLATIFPALKAAAQHPVDGMRYE